MDPENYFGIFGVDGKIKPCFADVVAITTEANTVANTLKDIKAPVLPNVTKNDSSDSGFSIPDIPKGAGPSHTHDSKNGTKAPKANEATDGSVESSTSCAMSPTASALLVSVLAVLTGRL
jgi:hypothetical protein